MGSYALLEAAHEVMVTTVKDSQPHTCTCVQPSIDLSCTNSYCSQAKLSCDEHVLVETCDSLITSENDELKRENEILKMELSQLKGKSHVQLSQDNRDHMVNKVEKGSIITWTKLTQINLKTSYQKVDKLKIKKEAHVKCFECSKLGHFSSECPNKKSDQAKPSRRQRSLSQTMCFACREKDHNIAICLNEEASKQICQNRTVRFGKPEYPVSTENFRTPGQCNKGFRCHLTNTWVRMKVPRCNPRTKQVGSSIKYGTLAVTNVTLVRIVLKLKPSFIRLLIIIYLIWSPRMTQTLSR
jgi:hypothetical protein